jgi:rhodanese-related sulfurtransferase/DNA-binding MarR family transcriptional regulator
MRSHREIKSGLNAQFARIGAALSSPKRLEILDLLSQAERSVEEIARQVHLSVGNTSAHLKVLHTARLVERRRDGQRVMYGLADASVLALLRNLQAVARERLAEVDQLVRTYYEEPDAFEPVTSDELLRRLKLDDVLVLDVRPVEEYAAGHVPGAHNVPPDELKHRLASLPRDQEIVAYCRGPYCLFAIDAIQLLRRQGFQARRLAGGFPDWAAEGRPVASGQE